jgi:hypothetical protein
MPPIPPARPVTGVVNLMKFATGMDPWIAGRPATSARIEGGDFLITFPRAKAALADGLVFRIESSDDLSGGSWQTLPAVPESIEDLGPIQRVTVAIPVINGQRLFLRLRVQSP